MNISGLPFSLNILLLFETLFNLSLLARFFAVFRWFPGHFYSFGILACGNFGHSNALDCLAFVQVLQHTTFSSFPRGGVHGCGNLPIFYFTGLESLIHWCKSLIARVDIKLVYSQLYDWESYQIMPTHSFAWQCKLTKKWSYFLNHVIRTWKLEQSSEVPN